MYHSDTGISLEHRYVITIYIVQPDPKTRTYKYNYSRINLPYGLRHDKQSCMFAPVKTKINQAPRLYNLFHAQLK